MCEIIVPDMMDGRNGTQAFVWVGGAFDSAL